MNSVNKRTIGIAIAFAFLFVVCVCISLALCLPSGSKPINTVASDGEFTVTPTEMYSGLRLSAATVATSNDCTLTATIEPNVATNTKVTWTVDWANKTSAWASGKSASQYITVTPSSNTLSATVTCKAPFGEQAVITASVSDNTSIKATCTAEYRQKYLGASTLFRTYNGGGAPRTETDFSTTQGNTDIINVEFLDSFESVYGGSIAFTNTYTKFMPVCSSVYTKPLTSPATLTYYVKVSDTFAQSIRMSNQMIADATITCSDDWVKVTQATVSNISEATNVTFETPEGYDKFYVSALFAKLCPEVESSKGVFDEKQFPYFLSSLGSIRQNPMLPNEDRFHFYIKIEAEIDGKVYEDIHKVYVTKSNIPAKSLSLDKSEVEF